MEDTTQCYGSLDERIEGQTDTGEIIQFKKGMIFLFEKEGWRFSLVREKNVELKHGLAGCRVRPLYENILTCKVKILEVI